MTYVWYTRMSGETVKRLNHMKCWVTGIWVEVKASDLLEKAGSLDFDAVACADVPGMKGHLLQAVLFFFLWIDTAFFGISFSSQNSSSQLMNSEAFLCASCRLEWPWQVLFKSAVKQQNVLEKVEQQGNLLSEVFSAAVMPSSGSDFFQWGHWEYGYLVLSPSDSPGNWLTQSYELFQSDSNFQSRKWENSTATKLNLSWSAFTPFEADFNKSLFAFLGKVEEMWLVGQWVIHDTWWYMRHTWGMIWCHVFLEISDFEFVLYSVDVVIWEIRLVVLTVHVLQKMIVCRLWRSLSRDAVQGGQKEAFFSWRSYDSGRMKLWDV